MEQISRRSFVTGAAAGAAAAGVLAAKSALAAEAGSTFVGDTQVSDPSEIAWDEEADLVVVGFGPAGASCAYHASKDNPDASIIVLEKQPEDDHWPNYAIAGGYMMYVTDVEKAKVYMRKCAGSAIPEDVTDAWAEEAANIVDWIREIGYEGDFGSWAETGEHPEFEGAEAVPSLNLIGDGDLQFGALFWDYMEKACQRDNITIEYDTPAQRLVYRITDDGNREVLGVAALRDGEPYYVKGTRATVLTCGGFGWNEELKHDYLATDGIYYYNNPDSTTGDGIIMAQDAGAQLWHMEKMIGRGVMYFEDVNMAFICHITPAPYVMVDKYGKRFFNEDHQAALDHSVYYYLMEYDPEKNEYPRIPCWYILDSTKIDDKLTYDFCGVVRAGKYDWSDGNQEEIDRGWIIKADTLEELAEQMDVPAENLVATMEAYDEACDTGEDEFGRDPENLVKFTPPYYAVKLWPGGSNTSGGPKRNANAQVINVWGEPIPRLYEAGELGQCIGALYPQGGADSSEAVCFGAIAARNAMAEEPWE